MWIYSWQSKQFLSLLVIIMDARVKDLYILILKKKAKVIHFLEYDHYYEIHLEWPATFQPGASFMASYFDDELPKPWIEKKLIAFEKVRR